MSDESDDKDPPVILEGHRIDVLENAFSWYIRSIDTFVSRDLDARMAHLPVARGKGKVTALLLVDGYPGIRPSEIAAILMRDRPWTGRLIDGLARSGLVRRDVAEKDQRAVSLSITPEGHEMANAVRAIIREQEAEFFDFIEPDDRAVFMRILKRSYLNMRTKCR